MTEHNQELEAEIGGQKIKVRGYHVGNLLQLGIALILGFTGYAMYEFRSELKQVITEQKKEHMSIAEIMQRQAEAYSEMNYILTLSPEDRKTLNLHMPESLRRKRVESFR